LTQTMADKDEAPERRELRSQLRRLLGNCWSDEHVRQYADGDPAVATRLATVLSDEMCLHALTAPESLGGLGAGCIEAAIVAEELGAAMAPSRILATTMVSQLLAAGRQPSLAGLLEQVTSGQALATLAWPGDDATWDVRRIGAPAVQDHVLAGTFGFVAEFDASALLLCPALHGGQYGIAALGPSSGQAGLTARAARPLDVFRPLHDISVSGTTAQWMAVASPDAFTGAIAAGAIVLSAEMTGAARACIERMVTYSKQRQQFGKQIGTFQSLKHRMVDVLVEWEAARALTYRAASQLDAAAARDDAGTDWIAMARMAKSAASDALRLAAKECIHVHGAIGITWESALHFYLKRWASSARLFGSPDQHRALVYQDAVAS
jgi:alkylation response protein AidB-like acyl-CoA dehydrogenase